MRHPRLDRAWSATWRLPLAALASLPVLSFFVSPGPTAAKALVAALLIGTALRPADAWLPAAGLAPLGVLLGGWIGTGASLTEPLVLAFLAGWLVHEAARPLAGASGRSDADRTALAVALLLGLAVLASLLVRLAAHHLRVDFPAPYLRALYYFLWHDYFGGPSRFRAQIVPAARLLEGIGLFVATLTLCGRCPRLGTRGARALAASAGVAALAAVVPLASRAIAMGWSAAFPKGIVTTSRISTVGRDVNAAGSYYALAFGAAAGLVAADRRYRLAWCAVGALTLAALWLTGSRAGLVAVAFVAVLMAAALGARQRGRPAIVAATVAVGLVVLVGGFLYSTAAVRTRAAVALEWRVEHGLTALRMFAAHPVFGAGVGRFRALSPEYTSPDWRRRGNAHNNFLQVLAELGLVGLALLAGLLGRVLWRTWRAPTLRSDPLLACLAGGVLAYVVTWLAGHPLLVFEAAAPFWLALGLLAGMTPGTPPAAEQPNETARPVRAWRPSAASWLLALVIVSSVVPRARAEIRQGDLSGAGMGFSAAHRDARGHRFRWMATRALLFVPATAHEVAVPFRSPGGPATVKLLVGEEVVARLVVERAWREALVSLPAVEGRRFVPLELRASVVPAAGQLNGAGKTTDTRVQVGVPRTLR